MKADPEKQVRVKKPNKSEYLFEEVPRHPRGTKWVWRHPETGNNYEQDRDAYIEYLENALEMEGRKRHCEGVTLKMKNQELEAQLKEKRKRICSDFIEWWNSRNPDFKFNTPTHVVSKFLNQTKDDERSN